VIAARPAAVLALLALAACGGGSTKPDEEALRNTFACDDAGERVVIRFDTGEARLLLASGERVNLYQVPSAAGTRYTNGTVDLYGKGTDLKLARDGGAPRPLAGCAPLAAAAKGGS
jgi:membrane-bound inhibitor of C-type lysozyme